MPFEITLEFDPKGIAPEGIDIRALEANVQAELQSFADEAKTKVPPAVKSEPPSGAQGDVALITWLIHLAQEPGMVTVYVRTLMFTLNELLRAARRNAGSKGIETASADDKLPTLKVRLSHLGKELTLPAAESVIDTLLKGG